MGVSRLSFTARSGAIFPQTGVFLKQEERAMREMGEDIVTSTGGNLWEILVLGPPPTRDGFVRSLAYIHLSKSTTYVGIL